MSNFSKNAFLEWLSVELSQRMAEKLEFIKISPGRSLVVDEASTKGLELLRRLYPQTELLGTSKNAGGLFNLIKNIFGRGIPKFFPVIQKKSGDRFQFDLPARQIDLLWTNAWRFHHDEDWRGHLQDWHRVLKEGGLLMFSYLGPDTGKELRGLFESADSGKLLGLDMHDMGDGLAAAGFSDPVMDMEYLTLTYEEADLLLKDAYALGLISENPQGEDFEAKLQQQKTKDGHWKLTIEIVYGHAWWSKPKVLGVATIRPDEIKVKSK